MSEDTEVEAWAPGRVNLIGDHTDYMGGLAMPMAIDLGTTVSGTSGGEVVQLTSAEMGSTVRIPLDLDDPTSVGDGWGRYVAGVVTELRPGTGFVGRVTSTLPIGSGLSSSAALEVAVALALGADETPADLASLCQRAEQAASGVPCGIMDQLAITSGQSGHALLLDCRTNHVTPVPLTDQAIIRVVHSGQERTLVGSEYADRRAQCESAQQVIGPLREASAGDVAQLADPILRRRATHVITEIDRVRSFAYALANEDLPGAGQLMSESHASLRDDFEVSTPLLDDLVARLQAVDGVYGARLTGAGFGGCAVAMTDAATDLTGWGEAHWTVRPAEGARRLR